MLVVYYIYLREECCILEVVCTCAQRCSIFDTADFLSLPVELSDATYKGLVRPKMVLFSPQLFFTNILGLFWPLFLLFHISLQLSCSSTFLFRKTNCNFNFKFVSSPVGFTLILKTYLQIAYREYFPDCEC